MSRIGQGPPLPDATVRPRVRVLVVEDDLHVAVRIRTTLEASGLVEFEVEHAFQVEEALDMLREQRHDVVLLDLTLPEGDGLDTLARARNAVASVPIVALSSEADEEQALRVLRLGAQDCLLRDEVNSRHTVRSLVHAVERHRLLTDLEVSRRREHYVATHDSLTALPNRPAFLSQLDRAISFAHRHDQRVAVLFLDLDGFKAINDALGHSAGDALLIEVAKRISGIVRKSDMVARLGGDEFVLMIQRFDRSDAPVRVARSLIEGLSEPIEAGGQECWVTASVGIAVFPENGSDADTLTQSADTAMYQAKLAGKSCYRFFDDSMNEAMRRRLDLESRLRRAIEHDHLDLHYQPQVELSTGRICGAEALLRWTDPDLGELSPSEFIPVAEETGLIRSIGAWALHRACREGRAWHDAGHSDIRVSLNLSPRQLDRELRGTVLEALEKSAFPVACLELDVAESALVEWDDDRVQLLSDLKQLGVSIALDDFGTGISSLACLQSFPVDRLKIDGSCVREIQSQGGAAVVGSIISIAESFELRVIAEGVETDEQVERLRRLGCHEMQGFGFSPPLPAEGFRALLARELLP